MLIKFLESVKNIK